MNEQNGNEPLPPRPDEVSAVVERILQGISRVVRGKQDVVRLLLTALFTRGHVLIEDVPGVGKTTLARALARCLGGKFRRIQFTSDLLPSDILGVSVFNQKTVAFEFKAGPIFANVVLADEINRTTPRTQSALLEALNEGQVTVDAVTYPLDDPFLVIATQNPIEFFGTYPLPESQLDRFLLWVTMGYPTPQFERMLIAERGGYDSVSALEPAVTCEEVIRVQRMVDQVRVESDLLDYLLAVVRSSRESSDLLVGVSPRGAIQWYRASQAHALLEGRDYVLPDDLKVLAVPVLAHRIVLASPEESPGSSRQRAQVVLEGILEGLPVPL